MATATLERSDRVTNTEPPDRTAPSRDTYIAGRDQTIIHQHGWRYETAGRISTTPPQLEYPARGRARLVDAVLRRPWGSVDLLSGAGGLGKSTVARAVAARAGEEGADVWWVSATDEARLSAGMRALAGQLGADPERLRLAWSGQDGDAPDLVWELLSQRHSPWLLILDNADDLRLLTARYGRVADATGWVRPPPPPGRLLITSRNQNHRAWGPWVKIRPLPRLSTSAAARALVDRTGRGAGSRAEAAALSSRLSAVPLVLHQAGLFLANAAHTPPWRDTAPVPRTFAAYQAALDQRFRELIASPSSDRSPLSGSPPSSDSSRSEVTATWELSLDLLAEQDMPLARPLLRLLAHFADVAVPYALVLHGRLLATSPRFGPVTDDHLQRLIDALADFGLLTRQVPAQATNEPIAYSVEIHPLIGETMRMAAAMENQTSEYLRLAVFGLAEAAAGRDPRAPEDRSFWELTSSHLKRMLTVAAQVEPLAEQVADTLTTSVALCVDYAISSGFFVEADGLDSAAAHVEAELSPDHPAVLRLRYQRARLTDRRGDPASAATAYRSVLVDRTRVFGADHPETLRTRHALAWVLTRLDDLDGAETVFRAVLESRNRVLGSMHPQTLWTRHDLAWVLTRNGSLPAAAAEREYRAILADRSRVLGSQHPHTLWTRHDLAWTLRESGNLLAAKKEFSGVLADRVRVLGETHPDTLWAWHELARTLELNGELISARQAYEAVLDARVRTLGREHRDTIDSVTALRRIEAPSVRPGADGSRPP